MRFFPTLLTGLSAIAVASAQDLFFTWIVPASVEVGKTYNVTYEAANINSPVTIILRKGVSTDLDSIGTLTSSATGGSFQWTVSDDLVNGADYALQIKQGSEDNYTKQFALGGSAASASASASSSSASSTISSSTLSTTVSGSSSTATASGSSSASHTASSASATGTGSSASASGSASKTSSSSTGAPTGAGANLKSPLALVFGAVAAIVYLH